MLRHLGPRRWIAWKLVCLAHRIYDATHHETVRVINPDGVKILELLIQDDEYGGGIFAFESRAPEGYEVEHLYRWPDYMYEDIDG